MIKYNTPIEVQKNLYSKAMNELSGIIAGTVIEGKYYIKLMIPKYRSHVNNYLTQRQ